MRHFGIALLFAVALCGCSASLQTRLKEAQPPSALVLPDKALSENDRIALCEAHRAYVNDLGVQIGRRHFDRSLLPDYFRRSGLEVFALRAEDVPWGEKIKAKEAQLGGKYTGILGSGSGINSWEAFVAALAFELVAYSVYQGWRAAAKIELDQLRRKAGPYRGTIVDLMGDYNSWLARSLGIKPDPSVIDPIQERLPPLPKRPGTGLNAGREDWLDSYRFGIANDRYYFGYQSSNLKDVLSAYGIDDEPDPFLAYRGGRVFGGLFEILGAAAVTWGGIVLASKDQPNSFQPFSTSPEQKQPHVDDSKWMLPLGAGLAGLGIGMTLHWKSLKWRDEALDRINSKIAAKVFVPAAGPRPGAKHEH